MSDLELRESSDGTHWTLSGIASKVEVPYRVTDHNGRYEETIARWAFTSTLATDPSVRLLIEHDRRGPLLARTGRNLSLSETSDGHLAFTAQLYRDDPQAVSAASKVRHGLLDQMSFGFRVAGGDSGQRWSENFTKRRVTAVDLHDGDVSLCVQGANPHTSVSIRSNMPLDGSPELAERVGDDVRGATRLDVRARYTQHEMTQLGKSGMAFFVTGQGFILPTKTRADLLAAIHAVPHVKADAVAVKRYLKRRAAALGVPGMIPAAWGSLSGGDRSVDSADPALHRANLAEVEYEVHRLRAGMSSTLRRRGESERDKAERAWSADRLTRALTSTSPVEQDRALRELRRRGRR